MHSRFILDIYQITYRSGLGYEKKILVYQKGFGFCGRCVYIKSEDIYSVNMSESKELTPATGLHI